MSQKLSIYFYLFNAQKRGFDAVETVKNFCSFADEVVCATVPSEDETENILQELAQRYENFRLIKTDVQIQGNNRFDGQLKTIAMNNCTNEYRIIADADERFVIDQRPYWNNLVYALSRSPLDGVLVPVIDLYGTEKTVRADKFIGQKLRLHKSTVKERGVPKFAELPNGLFDTSKSDSTDPIDENGNLCRFASFVNPEYLYPPPNLNRIPYVLHYGYLDLERRAKIGREFWKQCWEERSGKTEDVAINVSQLEGFPTIEHGLPLK